METKNRTIQSNAREFFRKKQDEAEQTITDWEAQQKLEAKKFRKEYKQLKALYCEFKQSKNEQNHRLQ